MLGLGSNIASIGSHCSVSSFSPEDVSNLQLWLKNNHSVTAAQWSDSSGNGLAMVQGTSGNQASVSEGGLDFVEGNEDHYDLVNAASDPATISIASQEAFMVFIVCNIRDYDSNNSILSTDNASKYFLEFQTNRKIRINTGTSGSASSCEYAAGSFTAGAKMVVGIQREAGATGNINTFKNGSLLSPTNGQKAQNDVIAFDGMGTRTSDRFFDGIIHELLCYDTADLTSDEITNINNYLTTKHGI
tara:strand:- start:55 stop:789 length:735 start_codon:yes stop_codon:yes gene_type:complete